MSRVMRSFTAPVTTPRMDDTPSGVDFCCATQITRQLLQIEFGAQGLGVNSVGVRAGGIDTQDPSPPVASSSKAGQRSVRAAQGIQACERVVKFERALPTAQHTLPAQQYNTCRQHNSYPTGSRSTTRIALPLDAPTQSTMHAEKPSDVFWTQVCVIPQ